MDSVADGGVPDSVIEPDAPMDAAGARDRQWGTPQLVESDGSASDIVVDASGYATAAWARFIFVGASRFVPGSGWGPGAVIGGPGYILQPELAVDPLGNVTVVWANYGAAGVDIFANRFVPGTGWGTAAPIETSADSAALAKVAVDASGNAIAVWGQLDGTYYSIWANRFVPGAGWGTAAVIETESAGPALNPEVAFDADGNAIAVWSQSDGTRSDVWANRFVPGAGWGTATLLEADPGDAFGTPQVGVDPSGNATAVWEQSDGTRTNIWTNRFVPGAGWGIAALLENSDVFAGTPQVVVDPAGNALAVWEQNGVSLNRFVPGSGWGTVTSTGGYASDLDIAVDALGNLTAVWAENGIWANRFVPGAGWGVAAPLDDDWSSGHIPQVAVDPAGNATVVWCHDDNDDYSTWSNAYR